MFKSFWLVLAQFFARKAGMTVTYDWRLLDHSHRTQQGIATLMPTFIYYEVDTRSATLDERTRERFALACYGSSEVPPGADVNFRPHSRDYDGQLIVRILNPKHAPSIIEVGNDQVAYLRDTHG